MEGGRALKISVHVFHTMPPKKGGKTNSQQAATGYLKNKLQSTANGGGQMATMAKKMDQLLSRVPRGTFATVGGALGGPTGGMIGKGISTLTGYGDYQVRTNSLINQTVIGEMADQVPMFRQQGADTRLKHCEYVTDIVVPADRYNYNVTSYEIDPTNPYTFPWLASVAKKYQRYKIKGMVVGYRSTSTDYQNSGVVAIAVNYDPAEVPYESMEGLLNTKFAVSTKPSTSMLAPVECDPSRSPLDGYYVKHVTSNDTNDATKRQTIMGKINVATSGLTLAPGTTLGQLYISYDIEFLYPYLHKQQVETGNGALIATVNFTNSAAVANSVTTYKHGPIVPFSAYGSSSVMVKSNGKPTDTGAQLPAGERTWLSLIMPVGTWVVQYGEACYVSSNTTLGPGTANTTAQIGASISATAQRENHSGGDSWSQYTLVVSPGTEEERTIWPASQTGRPISGGTTYIPVALYVSRLA